MKTCFAAASILLLSGPVLAQDEESKTWTGRWNNRKYGTTGPLKCVARETKPGTWNATFTGTYKGSPFRYTVTFQSKAGRGQTNLGGSATISGHQYRWTGYIKGKALAGRYRSPRNGYFGEFVLQEAKSRR